MLFYACDFKAEEEWGELAHERCSPMLLMRLEGELADFEKAVDSYLASIERLGVLAVARQAAARLQHNLQELK